MKYDKDQTTKLIQLYQNQTPVTQIAQEFDVPERSVIAKLSSLGVYKRKEYRNKRGEIPVKKDRYIEQLGELLQVDLERLESLEKCNKNVLILLVNALQQEKSGF